MAFQITDNTTICSTVCPGWQQQQKTSKLCISELYEGSQWNMGILLKAGSSESDFMTLRFHDSNICRADHKIVNILQNIIPWKYTTYNNIPVVKFVVNTPILVDHIVHVGQCKHEWQEV